MAQKFSPQLIRRIISHFQEKYGVILSEELAEQYLDNLAEFYMTFSEA